MTTVEDSIGARVKRRRSSVPPANVHFADLPDSILADVAAYLPKSSRALFAAAMTAPSSSWRDEFRRDREPSPTATSKAILSSLDPKEWEELDIGDVDERLISMKAKKLNDDDIHAVLACIDAANTLQSLKLTGCINVIGHGLELLRGSRALKQIDLSIDGNVGQYIWGKDCTSMISEEVVLPILNSLIDAEGNSFCHFFLPIRWREGKSPELDRFLEKYNAFMRNKNLRSSKCWIQIGERPYVCRDDAEMYGLSNNTCYSCLELYCGSCREDEHHPKCLDWCIFICKRRVCANCVAMVQCDGCFYERCSDCTAVCTDCRRRYCLICDPTVARNHGTCDSCLQESKSSDDSSIDTCSHQDTSDCSTDGSIDG